MERKKFRVLNKTRGEHQSGLARFSSWILPRVNTSLFILPYLKLLSPRIDDGHFGSDKRHNISRRYDESMYNRDCRNLSVCHRDELTASPSLIDYGCACYRSLLIEWWYARPKKPLYQFPQNGVSSPSLCFQSGRISMLTNNSERHTAVRYSVSAVCWSSQACMKGLRWISLVRIWHSYPRWSFEHSRLSRRLILI